MKEQLPESRALELAEKWLNGTISPEEASEYSKWYNAIDPNFHVNIPPSIAKDKDAYRQYLLQKINAERHRPRVISMRSRFIYGVTAAAVIIGLIVGVPFLITNKNEIDNGNLTSKEIRKDINPGTNGALLKLADGKIINLDTAGNGALIQNDSISITIGKGNLMIASTSTSHSTTYNELTTPRARQQQVTLSDGTKVWLNAASSIRFPSAFTGKQRNVEVAGEVYFEVAKKASMPFVVKVKDAEITVLGTHFNVMAYDEESALLTTLVEGAVSFKKGDKAVLLKPGQQTVLNQTGDIKLIKNADVETATAWKNGVQAFQNVDLTTIMRELKRWYDVEVEYNGEIKKETFSGEIPRTASLSQVLKLFQASQVNITIDAEHKKLIVTP